MQLWVWILINYTELFMQVRLEVKWGCCMSGEHFRSPNAYFSASVIYCATYGWRRGEVELLEFGPCERGQTPSHRSPTGKAALPVALGPAECRQLSLLGCLHLDQSPPQKKIFLGFFLFLWVGVFFPSSIPGRCFPANRFTETYLEQKLH